MRTLLAHVQSIVAFRTEPAEIRARRQCGRATETARCCDGLHEPRKSGACGILEGLGTLWGAGAAIAIGPAIAAVAIGVLIPVLPVLSSFVHTDGRTP